jgi:uncharacterized protein (TIGR02996 family)
MSPTRPPRPEVLAFLADVKERPDDDVPRLILADWLTERDDPRGEYLRLQVERARLAADDPRALCRRLREAELWAEHSADWLGPLTPFVEEWETRRGLLGARVGGKFVRATRAALTSETVAWIDRLHLSWATPDVLARLPPLGELKWAVGFGGAVGEHLARWPHRDRLAVLRLVGTHSITAAPAALATLSNAARLTALHISSGHTTDLPALLEAPALSRLRELRLEGHALNDQRAREYLTDRAGRLGGLRRLALTGNLVGSDGARALAGCPALAGLTELSMASCHVGGAGLAALAAGLPRLAFLDLSHNPLGGSLAEELAALRDVAPSASLKELRLRGNMLSPESATALAAVPLLSTVEALDLSESPMMSGVAGDVGHRALAASPHLGRLARLDLGATQAGDGAAAAVAGHLGLTELRLPRNRVGPTGVEALARSPRLAGLRVLILRINPLTGGLKALAGSPHLAALEALDVYRCGIGDDEVAALAASPLLAALRGLDLGDNRVTDRGAKALAASRHLSPGLWLNLKGNAGITGAGAGPLRERLGTQVFFG